METMTKVMEPQQLGFLQPINLQQLPMLQKTKAQS
jgi:hypothetical protein